MFEWAHGIIDQTLTLIRAGVVVFAVLTVAMVYVRTKAVVPVVVAALLAGAVIWAVNNIDWFEQKVGDETIAMTEPVAGVRHLRGATIHVDIAEDTHGDQRVGA